MIGAGGLGSPLIQYLAVYVVLLAAYVGTLFYLARRAGPTAGEKPVAAGPLPQPKPAYKAQ